MQNATDHRFTSAAPAGRHTAGPRNTVRRTIVHQAAISSVALRRFAIRRRLARIDPETAERRAMRAGLVKPQ